MSEHERRHPAPVGPRVVEAAIVVGDLLRPDGSGRPGGADRLTLWLWNAIKRQIYLASRLPSEALTTAEMADWIETLRPQADADAYWASVYDRLPAEFGAGGAGAEGWVSDGPPRGAPPSEGCPSGGPGAERLAPDGLPFGASPSGGSSSDGARAEGLASDGLPRPPRILDRLRGRFCIGYEMPPWLTRLLDEHALPYIDIRLHPIRFLDDLLFAVRASAPETQAALLTMAVHDSEVFATAGLREAMCRFISESRIPDNTLLVAGQRRFDSTQIVEGGFFDAFRRAAEVHAICAGYAAVILKPHPLDRHHSLLQVAAAAPTRVLGVIDDNVYRMLSLPQISGVLTVNSGLAHEAPYFAKQVHALAPLPIRLAWRGAVPEAGVHASLGDIVLTPDFWRIVLAPYTRVTPADGMRLPPKPNRLRIALDSFWNYQEIDTDRIPRPPS